MLDVPVPPSDLDSVAHLGDVVRWTGVLTSVVVVVGAWLLLRFTSGLVERLSARFADRRLLLNKAATFFQFAVYVVVGIVCIVLSFRIDANVLALIGGTVAVAVGFAIKDLVASFIAGIVIMVDRPFQVGDRISFGGQYGDITGIGLRSVRLQTLDDNTVSIPNNKFLSEVTSSGNYGALDMQVVMDFHVGLDQDIALARDIITEAAVTSRYVFLKKPVVVLVRQELFQKYVAVRLRLKAYVLDTKYEKAFESDVNLRVLVAFRAASIQPPAIHYRAATAIGGSGQVTREHGPSLGGRLG